jgi:2-polyprenyl-3-methyl-5-hydroxy-6-metoxy-1,4-benzoquinol methylase
MAEGKYGGAIALQLAVEDIFPDKNQRSKLRVLDVGAGTGCFGKVASLA